MRAIRRWLRGNINEIIIVGCIALLAFQANRPRLVVNVNTCSMPADPDVEIIPPSRWGGI